MACATSPRGWSKVRVLGHAQRQGTVGVGHGSGHEFWRWDEQGVVQEHFSGQRGECLVDDAERLGQVFPALRRQEEALPVEELIRERTQVQEWQDVLPVVTHQLAAEGVVLPGVERRGEPQDGSVGKGAAKILETRPEEHAAELADERWVLFGQGREGRVTVGLECVRRGDAAQAVGLVGNRRSRDRCHAHVMTRHEPKVALLPGHGGKSARRGWSAEPPQLRPPR
jgi:hypothetical protein